MLFRLFFLLFVTLLLVGKSHGQSLMQQIDLLEEEVKYILANPDPKPTISREKDVVEIRGGTIGTVLDAVVEVRLTGAKTIIVHVPPYNKIPTRDLVQKTARYRIEHRELMDPFREILRSRRDLIASTLEGTMRNLEESFGLPDGSDLSFQERIHRIIWSDIYRGLMLAEVELRFH